MDGIKDSLPLMNILLIGYVTNAWSRLNERSETEQVPNMQAVVHDWLHSDDLLSLLAEAMEMKFERLQGGGIVMSKIEYRSCSKCGQRYTTHVHSKITECFNCWIPGWRL